MTGISSIYIMDQKGRVLITRAYRADVPYTTNETFQDKMLTLDEIKTKPIVVDEENQIVYMHMRHQNLICNLFNSYPSPSHRNKRC